jgi:O-antigen/teichoic acid export membrane protein
VAGRALRVSFGAGIAGRLLSFGSGIVLARILAPEDFGTFALALVVVSLLGAVNELGTIPAVVRWTGDQRQALSTGMTLAFLGSVVAYGIAFAVAPVVAQGANTPQATTIIRLFALTLLLDGLNAMPQAVMYRTFRQGRFAVAEGVGGVVNIAVAIALAAGGTGAASLAWGRVVGAAVIAAIFWASNRGLPRPGWDAKVARQLVAFGLPLGLSHLVWEGILNLDYYIVGAVLGTVSLGYYLLAFNLASWPITIVSAAVAKVSFAAFCRLLEDGRERLPSAFGRASGVAGMLTLPMVAVIFVLTPEIIGFLYGDRWLPAVAAARLLVIVGGVRVGMELVFDLIAADGRSRENLVFRSIWLVVLVPALIVGARLDGLRGVGTAHLVVTLAVVFPLLLRSLARSGVPVRAAAQHLVRPVVATVAAVIAMSALLPLLSGDLTRLLVVGGVGTGVYALVALPRNPLVSWSREQLRSGTGTVVTGDVEVAGATPEPEIP